MWKGRKEQFPKILIWLRKGAIWPGLFIWGSLRFVGVRYDAWVIVALRQKRVGVDWFFDRVELYEFKASGGGKRLFGNLRLDVVLALNQTIAIRHRWSVYGNLVQTIHFCGPCCFEGCQQSLKRACLASWLRYLKWGRLDGLGMSHGPFGDSLRI